jgi:hypothetical protein
MADDRNSKLIIVFIVVFLLLNYPIIGIFDKRELWMGFPVLYFYLFFLWLLTIVAVGLIVKNKQKNN